MSSRYVHLHAKHVDNSEFEKYKKLILHTELHIEALNF